MFKTIGFTAAAVFAFDRLLHFHPGGHHEHHHDDEDTGPRYDWGNGKELGPAFEKVHGELLELRNSKPNLSEEQILTQFEGDDKIIAKNILNNKQ